jgi:hypothetical protein
MIKKGKETFSGYNKPKATPSHPTKSHAVLAKSGDKEKLIRFGQKGVSGDKTIQQEPSLLKQGTLKTLQKVRCLPHIGLTK